MMFIFKKDLSFSIFWPFLVKERPKSGENGEPHHSKCASLPSMEGLPEKKSIHGSAEIQFAVQESVKPNL